MTQRALEVLAVGPLALIQDLGRPGFAHLGVSASGAADRSAFRLGARLLAQNLTHAAIEVLFGGLQVRAGVDVTIALTGAPAPATIDGRAVGHAAPLVLRADQTLRLGTPSAGLRTYVSVRGGIDVPATLGSRSTDTLSALGPKPLRPGDRLPVGPAPPDFPNVDLAPVRSPTSAGVVVTAHWGPRADWLADSDDLARGRWTVSSRSDRIGVRLDGVVLARDARRRGDLPSEGVVRGAIQLPPSGQPVIFLADHPVTGGYPVVAVVDDDGIDRLAQAVPGQRVALRLAAYPGKI